MSGWDVNTPVLVSDAADGWTAATVQKSNGIGSDALLEVRLDKDGTLVERQGAEVEATAGLEGELHEMEQEELRLLQSLQEYQAKQQQTYRELEQTFAAQREELGEMRRQGSRSHQSSSVSVAGRSAAGLV